MKKELKELREILKRLGYKVTRDEKRNVCFIKIFTSDYKYFANVKVMKENEFTLTSPKQESLYFQTQHVSLLLTVIEEMAKSDIYLTTEK